MATAVATAAEEQFEPGEIISLDPKEITLGVRLRPIDQAWAKAIGQSMKREGQIHTVDVRPAAGGGWELAGAGGHRVTGARLAGIPIDAKVVLFEEDVARRREAAENLFRRSNDPIERADAIAELVRLHRENDEDEARRHRDRSLPKGLSKAIQQEAEGACDTMSHVYGWGAEIAAELGFSKRTIQRDLLLYRGLRPSVIQLFREHRHPVLKNGSQLRQLAKLGADEQERVATRMIDQGYGAAKSIGQAILLERGSNFAADPAAKRLSAFIGAFARMSLAEKKGALHQLGGMLPAGWSLTRGAEAQEIIDYISDHLAQDYDAAWLLTQIEREFGGKVQFRGGAYELRVAKLTASCTAGGRGLLDAWMRAAQRRAEGGAA